MRAGAPCSCLVTTGTEMIPISPCEFNLVITSFFFLILLVILVAWVFSSGARGAFKIAALIFTALFWATYVFLVRC
jgi:hypothetical protein